VCCDAGAVDKQAARNILGLYKRAEGVLPYPALGPAEEAVIKRLLGPLDRRAITPAPATLQGMGDPAEHTMVTGAPHTLAVNRQQRLNPRPLTI
jgi:hypothetical protein